MGLSVGQQVRYWGIAALVFLGAVWLLADVLLPFLVGAALAYALDPVVTRLQRLGLPRLVSTTLLALVVVAVVVVAGLLVIPAVAAQAVQLVEGAPALFGQLQRFLEVRFPGGLDAEGTLRQSLAGMGDTIREQGIALLQSLLTSVRGVVGAVLFIVITPVVAFYLLLDWPRLVGRVDELLPREHAPVIRGLAGDINRAVAGFVRGQLTVCLVLAFYYAAALMLAGLNYGLVVGVVTGLISFIPFIGAIVGGALAIGLALWQFWGEWAWIGVVVAIFAFGQFLEGNILVPRLVGRSVGLHPVWLLFALSAFGALFGFTGVLLAVPVAAALAVLVRFAVARYRESLLYRGEAAAAGSAGAAGWPEDGRWRGASPSQPPIPEEAGLVAEEQGLPAPVGEGPAPEERGLPAREGEGPAPEEPGAPPARRVRE